MRSTHLNREQRWPKHYGKAKTSQPQKIMNYWIEMAKCCQNCGERGHQLYQCQLSVEYCAYPHAPQIKHPSHSIYMCPDLHARCAVCSIRGHQDQAHNFGINKSPLEVRQQFKKFCHLGKYTSLPFLYNTGKLRNTHWKACLSSISMARGQGDLWMYSGLKESVAPEILERKRKQREIARTNLDSAKWRYVSLNMSGNPPAHKRRRC